MLFHGCPNIASTVPLCRYAGVFANAGADTWIAKIYDDTHKQRYIGTYATPEEVRPFSAHSHPFTGTCENSPALSVLPISRYLCINPALTFSISSCIQAAEAYAIEYAKCFPEKYAEMCAAAPKVHTHPRLQPVSLTLLEHLRG